MALKSLKASINLQSENVEDAIIFLSQRFLRATKTGCRVVQTSTEVCVADVCQPLIDGWMGGRVAYSKGKIAFVFRSGQLALEADMLIYTPKDGDRFLYTRPRSHGSILSTTSASVQVNDDRNVVDLDPLSGRSTLGLPSLVQVSEQLQALGLKLDALCMATQAEQPWEGQHGDLSPSFQEQSQAIHDPVDAQRLGYWQQQMIQEIREHLSQTIHYQLSQHFSQQLTLALDPIVHQLDDLQDQVETLTDYVAELDIADFDMSPPIPQTEEEWLERIKANWGTVGDYEKYSPSYRDANAEAPLHETPDWIALCESDWSWTLCPTLATLYELIRGNNGIGDVGADILQQLGQHIDPKTGDPYYLYQLSGYTALEALRQIAHDPAQSWLPELHRLWMLLADPEHPIFQLFGWESEAIAALEHLISSPQSYSTDYGNQWSSQSNYYTDHTESQTGYDSGVTTSSHPTLRDHQSMLNLGPFTPITVETLKRAYREAMKKAHPDKGGSTQYAQQINAAYSAVMSHYFPEINHS